MHVYTFNKPNLMGLITFGTKQTTDILYFLLVGLPVSPNYLVFHSIH